MLCTPTLRRSVFWELRLPQDAAENALLGVQVITPASIWKGNKLVGHVCPTVYWPRAWAQGVFRKKRALNLPNRFSTARCSTKCE
eukprot:scaffold2506_cov236-Pinguiococcus_pyrenoidosus.AAC.11